jgi:hypothetical protein
MLLLAGVEVDREEDMPTPLRHQGVRYPKVSAPIRAGVLDLRKKLDTAEESVDIMRTIINFIIDYKVFFVSVTLLILMVIFGALYIGHATNPDDDYQIIIDEGDAETTMSKDEVESVTGAGE